eukprot:3938034-Rhodomonas_salina.4
MTPFIPAPALKAAVAPPRRNECHVNRFAKSGLSRNSRKHSLSPFGRQSSGMNIFPATGATKPA